jgi:acetyl coenzyme A synthetase (ADP forming)-like protein
MTSRATSDGGSSQGTRTLGPVTRDGRYPSQWESDVVLADGSTAYLRPIRPEDAPALVALHSRLSDATIYNRFFGLHPELSRAEVERFTNVDYVDRMALVALIDDQLVAVARFDRLPTDDAAEVAFVVADAHQSRGLGTLMLEHLAATARERGITRFVADTLASNNAMLRVFREAGYEQERHFDHDVVRVAFPIAPTEASAAAIDDREHRAAVRSIERLLRPRSIAVIGAGRRTGTIGHELLRNLLKGGFSGPTYAVNPSAKRIADVQAYPSVIDVPHEVDLAVIAVPAPEVPEVIEECGAKKVRGVVVITAGFAETGPEGLAAERDLVRRAHLHGMRMVGPNCMGVVNTDPAICMNATFAPFAPTRGRVAFSSQSGALGIAILEEADRLGLGVSTFVSVGNKADVSGNDLLRFWEEDERSDVVLLYLESFGNPRTFSRVARRVSRKKPIVAVKSGRTTAGSRAASSHTAALASPDIAVDALFRQTGVIRVDTLEQLFDVAQVLVHQPLPAGSRVAIVGNAGGPGILATDAAEGAGLEAPELSALTQTELRSFLPGAAAVRNPVDLIASASADDYERALRAVLADDGVDAVIVIFIPPLVTQPDDVARAIATAAAGATKPVLAGFLAMEGTPQALRAGPRAIPSFRYPESAAHALAHAVTYARWRQRLEGAVPTFGDVDVRAARSLVAAALRDLPSGTWLETDVIADLLAAYGIPLVATVGASSPEEAVATADRLGYPVALKARSGAIVHKTDVGAVRLGLDSPDSVRQAFSAMQLALGEAMGGAVVQAMADPGVETIVGVVQDPSFGPLVMFGSGGTAVELFADRAFRILPLTDLDVHELVRSTRGSPLLFGYRGAPLVDVAALQDLLLRVGRLVEDIPEISEMDLNPVIVSTSGAVAVDAKLHLIPSRARPELAVRRLRAP